MKTKTNAEQIEFLEAPSANPKSPITIFIQKWCEAYRNHFGRGYAFTARGKDFAHLKALLETPDVTPEALAAMAAEAWATDDFHCRKAVTISGFALAYNEIAAALSDRKPRTPRKAHNEW